MDKNIADKNQTVDFLKSINNTWKIFNVKWVGKNIRFNDDLSAPLYPNDSRLIFLKKVVSWLDCWKDLPTIKENYPLKLSQVSDTHVMHYPCY